MNIDDIEEITTPRKFIFEHTPHYHTCTHAQIESERHTDTPGDSNNFQQKQTKNNNNINYILLAF